MKWKKRKIKPLLNKPTKPKWESCYLHEDKGQEIKLERIPNPRIAKVLTHNICREMRQLVGFELPNHLKDEWLYINHSRKRFKKNANKN